MSDLFQSAGLTPPPQPEGFKPLAERLRPQSLSEIVGQDHLLGEGGAIARAVERGFLPSLVLWGPPGVGKTTIARLLAASVGYEFQQISAVFSGVADLKKAFEAAQMRKNQGVRSVLFVDEIHRFNRAQQDSFLPYVEAGVVTLIGATTENPSFELNGALLSRCQVFVLKRLDETAQDKLIARAEAHFGHPLPLDDGARETLKGLSDGDGRYLLTLIESLEAMGFEAPLNSEALLQSLQKRRPNYDKDREGHYNLISALHKSVRGSDPDAALYWMARMLQGGEDPLYIARRLQRMASEDIGAADPLSLLITNAARETYEVLGSPEGELALAQAVVHMASAPKSNAVYTAFKAAMKAAADTGDLDPPEVIRNGSTKLMKQLGYGEGYIYDPDDPDGFSGQNYFPDGMKRPLFYTPKGDGHEGKVRQRLDYWAELRQKSRPHKSGNEYWWFYLFTLLAGFGIGIVAAVTGIEALKYATYAFTVPSIFAGIRRLHDINRSGWWLLISFGFGALVLLYWMVQPSQVDEEQVAHVFE